MLDFFNIDSALSEEERAVRDSVRHFVDERVLPIIGDCYVEGRFPKELIPEMAELGVFGANLPEEYGCAGLNNVAYGLIMQELERGDSGVRSFASVQGALAMYPIYAFGSEEQKKQYLPQDGEGRDHRLLRAHGARLRLESVGHDHDGEGAGRRLVDAERRARCGSRTARTAKIAVVWAKTNGDKSDKSIRGFIVPTDTHGLHGEGPEGQALAARERHERARVPGRRTFRPTRSCRSRGGLKSPLMCLTQARYGISWGAIGAAMACFEEALEYAKSRVMFDKADRRLPDSAGSGSPTCSPRS